MMVMSPRIDPAAAKAKLDSGEAIPLDVTSSLVYPAVSHRIPGAIRIPPERIVRGLQAARPVSEILRHFESLPADRDIIAYCT
jgi:rhodanese-related sulfurtransferase